MIRRFFHPLVLFPAAFGALWLGIVVWEITIVHQFDMFWAMTLNDFIGHSPTFDLTVLLLTSEGADWVMFILAAIVMGRMFRISRTGPFSWVSYLTFALCIGILVGATYQFVDLLDSFIRRDPPAVALESSKLAGAFLGAEFDPPMLSRFPSERAAIYTMMFFLSLFRFGLRAWPLGAILIIVSGTRVIAGYAWPMDILGGMMIGWIVTMTVYVTNTNQVFDWLDKHATRYYRHYWMDRVEDWLARARVSRQRDSQLAQWDEGEQDKGKPLGEEQMALLRERWGFDSVEPLGSPHKNKLYPLRCDGRAVAFKISRMGATREARLAAALEVASILCERGAVKMPGIVRTRSGALYANQDGRLMYVMDWVEGRTADISNPEQFREVIRALARLHRATEQFARPGEDTPQTCHEWVNRTIEEKHRLLKQVEGEFDGILSRLLPENAEYQSCSAVVTEATRLELMMRMAALYAVEDRSAPRLCYVHGDSHPMNYLFDGQGDVILLDFDGMGPGLAFADLSAPLQKFMRRYQWKADLFRSVMDEYVAIRPLDRWEMALLLADMLFPLPVFKILKKRKWGRFGRERRMRLSVMKDVALHSLLAPARREFLEIVAKEYGVEIVRQPQDAARNGLGQSTSRR